MCVCACVLLVRLPQGRFSGESAQHTHTSPQTHTVAGLSPVVLRCCGPAGLPGPHRRGSCAVLTLQACGCVIFCVTRTHRVDVHIYVMTGNRRRGQVTSVSLDRVCAVIVIVRPANMESERTRIQVSVSVEAPTLAPPAGVAISSRSEPLMASKMSFGVAPIDRQARAVGLREVM